MKDIFDKMVKKMSIRFKEKGWKSLLLFVLIIICGIGLHQYKYMLLEGQEYQVPQIQNEDNRVYFENMTDEESQQKNMEISLYARAAALLDGRTGRVLFEKSGEEVLPMASTTKIMTCILALEYGKIHPLDKEWVTVSAYAASQPKVKAGLKEGEKYLLSDLLYSMMLESHNDTAVAVAEHIGSCLCKENGTSENKSSKDYVKKFTDMMDEKALELGCRNTNFVTPNGLDGEDEDGKHSTTAIELGKIAAYAMQNDKFRQIIQTAEYGFMDQSSVHSIRVSNKNAYLTIEEGACGIKTGFTNQAGYCFVGARQEDEKLFISVVLGSGWPPEKSKKWSDTRKIMKQGVENYEIKTIVYHDFEQYMSVDGGTQSYCRVASDVAKEDNILLASWEKIHVFRYQTGKLQAPVQKGEIVGYQVYQIGEEFFKKIPIRAQESISVVTIMHCIKKVTKLWLL